MLTIFISHVNQLSNIQDLMCLIMCRQQHADIGLVYILNNVVKVTMS